MKIFNYFICVFLLVNACFSQTYTEVGGGLTPRINYRLNPELEDIDRRSFLNQSWKAGKIVFKDSTIISLPKMNFNLANDAFLFKEGNIVYIIPQSKKVSRIEVGEDQFLRIKIDGIDHYMKILTDGSVLTLLEYLTCKLVRGAPSKGFIEATKDEFVIFKTYYVQNSKGDTRIVNPKKAGKVLSAFLPTKTSEISKFKSKENVKLKDIQSLIKLAYYLNSNTD